MVASGFRTQKSRAGPCNGTERYKIKTLEPLIYKGLQAPKKCNAFFARIGVYILKNFFSRDEKNVLRVCKVKK